MEEIQLKDICDLDNGYAFKSDDYVEESETLNCRMSNIRPDGSFDILYSAKYLPDEFAEKYEDYVLKDGDLIIAMTDMAGDPKILGVPTVVDTKGYTLLLNQRVGKLRFIKAGVNADYLKLALQSKRVREYLKRFAGGGVQLNVSKKDILNAPVRMRTIEEQDYIADLFQRVLSLKKLREQELQSLDNLIKARFVEMFVSKNYPRENLDSLSFGKGEYGAQSASVEYDPSRPRYVRITDINDDGSLNEDYVCSSNIEDDETYKLTYGDFCFARMGATVGKTYAYKSGNQIFAGYLIRYKLRLDRIIPEYLYEFTRLDEYWNWVLLNQSGAAQPGINSKKYGSLLVPVAPLEEQQKFAEFVKQVDKSKVGGKMNYLKIFLQGFIASLPSIVAVVGIVVNNHRASGRMKNDRLVKYKLDNINELLNYFNEVQILYMEIMSSYKIELLNVSKNILDGKFDTRESNFMDNCYLLEKKALLMAVYKSSILKSMNISIMSDEIAEYIVGFVRKITMYHFMIEHITKSYIVSYNKTGDVDESRKELIEKLTYEKDFSVKTKGLTNKQRIELAERIQHYFGIYTTEESELKLDMVLDISVDAKKRIKNAIDYIVYDYCDEIEKNEKTEILDEYERNVAEEIMRLMK